MLRSGAATVLAALTGPAFAVLAVATPARAAAHAVTTTADTDDLGACANGAITAGAGADNQLSLREAVCRARNAGTGTVSVPAGTYTLTQGALAIRGGNGTVDLTIGGAGPAATVIDGNATDRVIDVDPTGAGDVHLALTGVTVRNGRPSDGYGGGGILAGAPTAPVGNTVALSDCRITGNVNDAATVRTNAPGGGVAMAGGDLSITGCVISGNTSGSSAGGGVWFSAQRATDDLLVDGTTFHANTMANTSGPGTTFNGGAALALRADAAGGSMVVTGSRFTDNAATGSGTHADARGGAVYVHSGSPTFDRTVFTGNTATGTGGAEGRGGALYAADTTTLSLSRVVGNTSSHGGAVHRDGGTLTAARTWWGCNGGPGTTGCDGVTGTAVVEPYLRLGVTVEPASVATGATATATAGFRKDSAGADVDDPLGPLAGLPVTWTATGGTLTGQQATIQQGRATATYTGSATGAGSVRAVVDGQQADGAVTVTAPPVAPDAPTIGTASVTGPGTLTVTWTAPAGPVDAYRVWVASGGPYAAVSAGTCAGPPAASPCTVTGLTPGTPYTVTVSGVTGGLEGPRSGPTAAVTAVDVPAAPGTPTVAVAGDRSLRVDWTGPTPTADRPVTGHRVESSADGAPYAAVQGCTASGCVVGGLTAGVPYRFRVTAVNAAGDGPASDASAPVQAVAAPDAPTIGTASVTGPATLTVTWTAPAGPVDAYRVYAASGGPYAAVSAGTCAGPTASTPCTVTGLTPGVAYTFQVSAVRSGLEGVRSGGSTAVTALAAATAPTATTATPTDGGATIAWTPPQPTDGVTGYTATAQPGGHSCDTTGTTCAIAGLTNGTDYLVSVVAHSPAGDSTAGASASVRPGVAPGAPTAVQAVAGVASITVSWTAPAQPGTGVAGYLVTATPGPATCETTGATTCVLGAEAGKDYTVTVVARGTHGGTSPQSQPSQAVRPATPEPPATPPATTLTLTADADNRVAPGQRLLVTGTGFAPFSTVTVTVYSEPVVLATATADGNGSFQVSVEVPDDLPAGRHAFVALGVDPQGQPHALRLDLTVPAAPAGDDSLPVTGVGMILMVVTGLSLLAGGAVLRRLRA
ncbi:hypothetical protein Voc01_096810 [Virgisporangium ochraceum]|uniref:Fibronectin type-III domain-containing protein n=1 Tax=Virgisporangium ochraceum TaxID=65505 RepID=A0A8J4A2X3_9ACTN|nr:hypothetical protein Voc01_096810 [Virgisporangium ochraceum]